MVGRKSGEIFRFAAVTLVAGLLLLSLPGLLVSNTAASAPAPSTALVPKAVLLNLTLADDQTVRYNSGGVVLVISDHVTLTHSGTKTRAYTIAVTTNDPNRSLRLTISTDPVYVWSGPHQFPWGEVGLPPLANWTWTISRGTTNTSYRWIEDASGILTRTIGWANVTYVVTGTSTLTESVSVHPSQSDGTVPTLPAFMMINPGGNGTMLPKGGEFDSLAQSLDPTLIRIGLTSAANISWNVSTGKATFDLSVLDRLYNFTRSVGASLYLSIPAGNWGDGNTLPPGMPLNRSLQVTFGPRTGYFPQPSAYAAYVRALVHDVAAQGLNVSYWNIGNEVPTKNGPTTAAAYVQLYNIAAGIIHRALPAGRVGSDIMMQSDEIDYFAATAHPVDFLSFHYYPDNATCPNPNVYCIPDDSEGYLRDSSFWDSNHTLTGMHFVAPALAQLEWYNMTGRWLPVLDSESNFAKGHLIGTDPRAQTLFGGTWLASTLIDASLQNVTALTYFSLEGPVTVPSTPTGRYGGWGFGMTAETPSDNITRYAPYWAMNIWAQGVGAGGQGVNSSSSNESSLQTYAVERNGSVTVFLVNRVDALTTVTLALPSSSNGPVSVELLDGQTYRMSFKSAVDRVVLGSSGISQYNLSHASSVNVSIHGYGVASLTFALSGSSGRAETPGPGQEITPRISPLSSFVTPPSLSPGSPAAAGAGSTSVPLAHAGVTPSPSFPSAGAPMMSRPADR